VPGVVVVAWRVVVPWAISHRRLRPPPGSHSIAALVEEVWKHNTADCGEVWVRTVAVIGSVVTPLRFDPALGSTATCHCDGSIVDGAVTVASTQTRAPSSSQSVNVPAGVSLVLPHPEADIAPAKQPKAATVPGKQLPTHARSRLFTPNRSAWLSSGSTLPRFEGDGKSDPPAHAGPRPNQPDGVDDEGVTSDVPAACAVRNWV
jgi:hypothetical protein